jgi:predicted ATPase
MQGQPVRPKIAKLRLSGFKSISSEGVELSLEKVNVLIGPNGAGKSNLIQFFRMLNYMLAGPTGNLQGFVAEQGGANALLHDGARRTSQISACLQFETAKGENLYDFRLIHSAGDTLIFAEETCCYSPKAFNTRNKPIALGGWHKESKLLEAQSAEPSKKTITTIRHLLRQFVVYQFHDTSPTSRLKLKTSIHESHYLQHDAGNLAAFLLSLHGSSFRHYRRIIETIRQVAPFFEDFVLDPEYGSILLRWKEFGSDATFAAYQASDGLLRTFALITLLLQPEEKLPALLVIDEPELGLHPFAINLVAGLIQAAAQTSQILISTQSPRFVDQFETEDIVVVERTGRASSFERLDAKQYQEWLDAYSVGELWQKNVFGGRPTQIPA